VRRIECETLIGAPPERCFDLSRSVELHLEAAASTGERAVGGVTSGLLGAGDTVTWEARHLGRRWRLTARIAAYDRRRFTATSRCAARSAASRTTTSSSPRTAGRACATSSSSRRASRSSTGSFSRRTCAASSGGGTS